MKPKNEPMVIRAISLSSDTTKIMELFGKDASDVLGWTVSGSAIVRALLRHADQQGYGWARSELFPFVEHEISSGVVWGKKK